MASKNHSGTIRIWSNDARDLLIDLWSKKTIQLALENSLKGNERGTQLATGKQHILLD